MYDLIIFFILITVGYIAGTLAEKRHYRSIRKRENALGVWRQWHTGLPLQ